MSESHVPYYAPEGAAIVTSIVDGRTISTWTTPHMRAEHAFMRAAELLSIRKREDAIAALQEHLGHVRDLIAVLQATPRL